MPKAPESGASSSPDWTRTSNPSINSRMLCQLSYGGLPRAARPGQPSQDIPRPQAPDAGLRARLGQRGSGLLSSHQDSRRSTVKLSNLVFAGAGYVLGARAGRDRYDQIVRLARRVSGSQTVQATAGVVQAQFDQLTAHAKQAITEKLTRHPSGASTGGTNGYAGNRR